MSWFYSICIFLFFFSIFKSLGIIVEESLETACIWQLVRYLRGPEYTVQTSGFKLGFVEAAFQGSDSETQEIHFNVNSHDLCFINWHSKQNFVVKIGFSPLEKKKKR